MPTTAPAGWYPDPADPGASRYWDGEQWTASSSQWAPPRPAVQEMPAQAPPPSTPWAPPSFGRTDPWATPGATPGATPWATTAPPPSPWSGAASRSRFPWIAVVACLVIAAFIGGLVFAITRPASSSSSAVAQSPFGFPGVTTPTTQAPPKLSGDQAILQKFSLTQADIGTADTVALIQNGDQVQGTATLDLCNGTYASEALRVSRRQVATANSGLSTEAVLYDNTAATAQAFTELRSVVAKCPHAPVPSPVGEETVETVFNAPPDGSWSQVPGVERLAYDLTTTSPEGTTRSIAVYLRRGRALLGMYFSSTGPQIPVEGKTAIADIVTLFAQRVAGLPGSVVNGHVNAPAVQGAV